MGYIIIDLEFNNLKNITNYQKDFFEKYGEFDSISLENEIIEIGAVKVDKYMKPIKEIREYIKPKIFPVINPIVTGKSNRSLSYKMLRWRKLFSR